MSFNAGDFIYLFEVAVPPQLVLSQMGLSLTLSDDFPRILGVNGNLTLADPSLELETLVRRVKRASREGLRPGNAFKIGYLHHLPWSSRQFPA